MRIAKKFISFLLAATMAVGMLPTIVFAAEENVILYAVEGGNIYFDTSTGTITDCDESVTSADIPESIEGVDVTSIGDKAFYDCSNLVSVILPDGVTSIGDEAFAGCSNLIDINIPGNVTSIGKRTFEGCSSVSVAELQIETGEGNKTDVSEDAEQNEPDVPEDTERNEINIPREAAENIIPYAVEGGDIYFDTSTGTITDCDDGVTSADIPATIEGVDVTVIADCAFRGCSSLTSINIPQGVTKIGGAAFYDCTSLESISIPNSVTEIGSYSVKNYYSSVLYVGCFGNCTSLTSISLPDSITSIGCAVFQGCTGLTEVVIPDSVIDIGCAAFYGCTNLQRVVLPEGIKEIESYYETCYSSSRNFYVTIYGFFGNCTSLTDVALPDSIEYMGMGTFYNCSALSNILLPQNLNKFEDEHSNILNSCVGGADNYGMFTRCKGINNIVIPESVKNIAPYAFNACSNLNEITIPSAVTQISYRAFRNCDNLTDIYYLDTKSNWKEITIMDGNDRLFDYDSGVIIHCIDGDIRGVGTSTDEQCDVNFFSSWNAETKTVTFGDSTAITPDSYILADDVDTSKITPLLNKYVRVTMENTDALDHIVMAIEPVESKVGTVLGIGENLISFETGKYLPVSSDIILDTYKDKMVLYHFYNNEVVKIELLEEKSGILEEWDPSRKVLTVDGKKYPTNYLTDLSFLANIDQMIGKQIGFYVAEGDASYTPVIKMVSYETKIGTLTNYDSSAKIATIDGNSIPVDSTKCSPASELNGKRVFYLLQNNKIVHIDAIEKVTSVLRVDVSPTTTSTDYKNGMLTASNFPIVVTVYNSCSYTFPEGYDKSAVYAAAGAKSLKLTSVKWEGSPELSFTDFDISTATIGIGESKKATVSTTVNGKYKPAGITDTLTGTITVLGEKAEGGQVLSAQSTFSLNIKNLDKDQGGSTDPQPGDDELSEWAKLFLQHILNADDVYAKTTPGKYTLGKYFDNETIQDITRVVTYWTAVAKSEQAQETRGQLPNCLKIEAEMNRGSYKGHKATLVFKCESFADLDYAKFNNVQFNMVDNSVKGKPCIVYHELYSIEVSGSPKEFAKGIDERLQAEFGGEVKDFCEKLGKDAIKETITDVANTTGKEYLNTMLDIFTNIETIAKNAKKYMDFEEKASKLLNNPLQVSAESAEIFNRIKVKNATIKCPVNVYVYNPEGELCGAIENDVIVKDTLETFMDVIDGEKSVWTANSDYQIKLMATGEGTMKYEVKEYTGWDNTRTVTFNNVPLTGNITYEGNIPEEVDIAAAEYALKSNKGEVIYPDNDEMLSGTVSQNAPATPELQSKTDSSIILKEIASNNNGAFAQYSKDGGITWQDSPRLIGLSANTEYNIVARYSAIGKYKASPNSSILKIVTDAAYTGGGGGSSHSKGSSGSKGQSIKVSSTINGTLKVHPTKANKGDKVLITAKPDFGCQLRTLTVVDKNGEQIKIEDQGNNQFVFAMPNSNISISAVFERADSIDEFEQNADRSMRFIDVFPSSWFYNAVKYVYDNALMRGTTEETFSPEKNTTRGMIIAILYRMEDQPAVSIQTVFTDIAENKYYSEAIKWASEYNIISGYEDGTFRPQSDITREQLAAILYRYAVYKRLDVNADFDLTQFADSKDVSVWAEKAVKWMVQSGIVSGRDDNKLSPQAAAKRSEVAQILMNLAL